MRLPDFLIIGAMKCGTSTLAAQLGAQPGLFMTTPKEPNFFSDDAIYARGLEWYGALFDGAAPTALRGEASTHYTKLPTHPHTIARLAEAVPEPRLIYLIRDPVERAISHYIHEWTMGTLDGGIGAALESHPELVSYGRYAFQIDPWVERFGAERILVGSLEAMKADPQGMLDRVGAFLGCGPLAWQADLERMNVSAERIRRLPLQGLLIDNAAAAWLRRRLVPQGLRDRIKAGRRMQARPELSPADRARLEEVFAADRLRLHALFPGRADLDASYPFLAPAVLGAA